MNISENISYILYLDETPIKYFSFASCKFIEGVEHAIGTLSLQDLLYYKNNIIPSDKLKLVKIGKLKITKSLEEIV